MPKITDEELEPKVVKLFKKDLDKLRQLYTNNIGVSKAIRAIVHSFLLQLEAKTNKTIDQAEAQALTEELMPD